MNFSNFLAFLWVIFIYAVTAVILPTQDDENGAWYIFPLAESMEDRRIRITPEDITARVIVAKVICETCDQPYKVENLGYRLEYRHEYTAKEAKILEIPLIFELTAIYAFKSQPISVNKPVRGKLIKHSAYGHLYSLVESN